MKKILILSFYYSPDLSAGSFRIAALIETLKNSTDGLDITIDVITTMPNRYHQHKATAARKEQNGNVCVNRIQLPAHKNGFIDQVKAFTCYFFETLKLIKHEKYDLVFVTSGRQFSAFLGSIIARKKQCPLYLDIRDVFTDSMRSILHFPKKQMLMPFFNLIEYYTFKRANGLNLVSKGFNKSYDKIIPADCQVSYIPNGIDNCFQNIDYTNKRQSAIKRVLYAGNFGTGQAIDLIIPQLAKAALNQCEFILIGSGGRLNQLQKVCENLSNVTILGPIPRNELIAHYQNADILFLHLNDLTVYDKVLPSKLFEYAITEKPILAGIRGYSAEFVEEHIPGSWLFDPCDGAQGIKQLQNILENSKMNYERNEFNNQFDRTQLMEMLANNIVKTII